VKNIFEQMTNKPNVIVNIGNQFKENTLYMIWLATKWCGFVLHTLSKLAPYAAKFPHGLIYQHVSGSVPSTGHMLKIKHERRWRRVLIKLEQSRAMLAQHVKAPKQELTQQLVLMRLGLGVRQAAAR